MTTSKTAALKIARSAVRVVPGKDDWSLVGPIQDAMPIGAGVWILAAAPGRSAHACAAIWRARIALHLMGLATPEALDDAESFNFDLHTRDAVVITDGFPGRLARLLPGGRFSYTCAPNSWRG